MTFNPCEFVGPYAIIATNLYTNEREETMSSQGRSEQLEQPVVTRWLTDRAAKGAVTISFVLGYLMSVLETPSLTLMSFLAFTVVNGLYGAVLWWLYIGDDATRWRLALSMIALSLLTFTSGTFVGMGIGFNWLLYFVTVSLYFTYLSMRAAIIASLAFYLASAINIFLFDGWKGVFPGWLSILAGFCFVGAFSLANRLLHREQQRSQSLLRQLEASNRELEAAHQQLQIYANEVEELAVARERTRMAREIHDTLGHYLAIIRIQLETISKLQEHDYARARAEVEEAKRVAAQCIQEVRNAVAALRPTSIATLNSIEALTQLGAEFRATSPEIELTLDLETTLPPLSAELQLACYRAAQEALTNVRKHAHATKVLLRLRYEDETLELMVRDNGKGIPGSRASQQTAGFGLIGLRERIELLSGQVSYGPLEPFGYRVTVLIRLPHADPDPAHLVEQGEAV